MTVTSFTLGLLALLAADFPWPQWGGPTRDFQVSAPIAETWGEEGPPVVWSRPFGEGYSTIVCDGPRLFSLLRRPDTDEEVLVALDAATGETEWEASWKAPIEEDMDVEFGPGPHSTPVLVGDLVIAVGVTVKVHAVDRVTGERRWSRDLRAELGATHLKRGYCASPIARDDVVIFPIGGEDQALVALDQETGEIAWKGHTFGWSYCTPLMIDWQDGPELIVFWEDAVGGVDPANGAERWRIDHVNSWRVNVSTPVWDAATGMLFVSSAYGLGSRGIRLRREAGETIAEDVWQERRVQVHHGNAVVIGDRVYASSGRGPAAFAAIDLATGELAWRDRAIGKATILAVDGRMLILEDSGDLILASGGSEGLEIHARATVLQPLAWSAPTLVGTRLFIRDRESMKALDLE